MADYQTVQDWIALAEMERIHRMRRRRESLDYLRNDIAKMASEPDGSPSKTLAPNVMVNTIRRVIPSLYFNDPIVRCKPTNSTMSGRGEVVAAMSMEWWNKGRLRFPMRSLIANALLEQMVIGKVGVYPIGEGLFESYEDGAQAAGTEHVNLLSGQTPIPKSGEHHNSHIATHQAFLDAPELQENPAYVLIKSVIDQHIIDHYKQDRKDLEKRAYPGHRNREHWPYLSDVTTEMFWEPVLKDPQDSAYLIHRMDVRLADIKGVYKGTENLTPDSVDEYTREILRQRGIDGHNLPDSVGYKILYYVYDAKDRTVGAYLRDADGRPLSDPDEDGWPQEIDGYPIRTLSLMPFPDDEGGVNAIIDYVKPMQDYLTRLFSQVATHTDGSGSMVELVMRRFDESETEIGIKEKLEDAAHRTAYKVSEPGAINPVVLPQLDPEIFRMMGLLRQSISENLGVSETPGIQSADSATQASILGSVINIILKDQINQVAYFQKEIVELGLQHLKLFGPDSYHLEIVSPQGQEWEEFVKEDIDSSWNIEIDTPAPDDSDRERAMILNLFHEVFPALPPKGQRQLISDVLRTHGRQHIDLYYDVQDPEVTKQIALEHQLMTMGQQVQADPFEATTQHIEGHSLQAQEWMKEYQMISASRPKQVAQDPQTGASVIVPDQAVTAIQQKLQLLLTHLQSHQQLSQQEQPDGRRRGKVPVPTGNPGRSDSILSAQISGG